MVNLAPAYAIERVADPYNSRRWIGLPCFDLYNEDAYVTSTS